MPKSLAQAERIAETGRAPNEQVPGETLYFAEGLAETYFANGTRACEFVGDVEQRIGVLHAAIELKVAVRFLASPDLVSAPGDMVVVVVLVEKRRNPRGVNDRDILQARGFNQPMVKPKAADGKVRNRGVYTLGEDEDVNTGVVFVDTADMGAMLDGFFPIRIESERLGDVQVDTFGDEKRLGELLLHKADGAEETAPEDDIGVHVTERGEMRGGFRFVEEVAEKGRTEFVGGDVGDMLETQFAGDFCGAFVFAEENDFGAGLEHRPALNGVALDDADVAFEGFRNGKDRQHLIDLHKHDS